MHMEVLGAAFRGDALKTDCGDGRTVLSNAKHH